MAATYVIDMVHYMDVWDPNIDVPVEARRFANYVGAMARAYTAAAPRPGGAFATPIRCHRRPARRPCPGRIVITPAGDGREPAFFWECPSCGEQGRTTGFTNTPWDASGRPGSSVSLARVVIPEAHYRQLESLTWFDEDVARLIYGAGLVEDGIALAGTVEGLDELVNELASHVNHLPVRKGRELAIILDDLAIAVEHADPAPIIPFRPRVATNPHSRSGTGATSARGPRAGYVQVSRKGAFVFVAGALALGEQGVLVGAGDPAHQARQCLLNIEAGLSKAGARLEDLVRTRVYVRSVRYWPAVLQVFTEVLGKERPVNTVIEVQALVDPAALVAIEADAMVGH